MAWLPSHVALLHWGQSPSRSPRETPLNHKMWLIEVNFDLLPQPSSQLFSISEITSQSYYLIPAVFVYSIIFTSLNSICIHRSGGLFRFICCNFINIMITLARLDILDFFGEIDAV